MSNTKALLCTSFRGNQSVLIASNCSLACRCNPWPRSIRPARAASMASPDRDELLRGCCWLWCVFSQISTLSSVEYDCGAVDGYPTPGLTWPGTPVSASERVCRTMPMSVFNSYSSSQSAGWFVWSLSVNIEGVVAVRSGIDNVGEKGRLSNDTPL